MIRRLHVITPTLRPIGGVVKLADYALHAAAAGCDTTFHVTETTEQPFGVVDIDRYRDIGRGGVVPLVTSPVLEVERDDVVLFSWPPDYPWVAEALPRRFKRDRVVHLVQNVRHANPAWLDGAARRLLTKPMTRICVTQEVRDAIAPFVNNRYPTDVIPLGHAWPYFSETRSGGLPRPLRVGYTTWKSDIGDRVQEAMRDEPRVTFEAVRGVVGWDRLRDFYQHIDVFLATPRAEEGFYIPGLEAMAAGAIVVTPDAGGNRAYCTFGVNCIQTPLEDVGGYVAGITRLAEMDTSAINDMRTAGYTTLPNHDLAVERQSFAEVLDRF